MNTLVNRILNTAISITIGSIILVSGLWIADRLGPSHISCEDNSLSNFAYLVLMVIVAAIGIIYQFTIARRLRNKIKAGKILGFLSEIIVFAVCFTALMICMSFIGQAPVKLDEFLLIGLMLGGVYSVSIILFRKIVNDILNKFFYERSRATDKTN